MMSENRQNQKAGDNSRLVQAGTINVYNGIDETRAREIVDEKLQEVLKEYSLEAQDIAQKRISVFANDLIPRLVRENLLDNLNDPSIQMILHDAQRTAASTERKADYALLSELLIHRMKKKEDRSIRAGVSRAVKIIDEITDEALLGLTVAHCVTHFIPTTGNIKEGLKALDIIYSKVIYNNLPSGNNWIDDLEVLGSIRVNPFIKLKRIQELYSEALSGYVDVGIEKTSDNYQTALEIAKEAGLPVNIICNHELREGYVRLNIVNVENLEFVEVIKNINIKGQIIPMSVSLNEKQKQACKEIYTLYNKNVDLKNENIVEFMKMWDDHDNLKKLREWWETIHMHFTINSTGKLLAHANARRCDTSLPDLNEEI